METNQMTLQGSRQAQQKIEDVRHWMSGKCETLSKVFGIKVTMGEGVKLLLGVLLLTFAFVLCTSLFEAYGWAALCLTLAVRNLRNPVLRFWKGGRE